MFGFYLLCTYILSIDLHIKGVQIQHISISTQVWSPVIFLHPSGRRPTPNSPPMWLNVSRLV
jgi:hypothetical protein